MYLPGYMSDSLVYGRGGLKCYNRYHTTVTSLSEHPHAVAFIAVGGLLSFIAQCYDQDLLNQFASRPSAQVTNFAAGQMLLVEKDGTKVFFTVDQYAATEADVLIGQISTGNPSTDTLLWPPPSVLEEISDHYHGAWMPGCYSQLENSRKRIFVKKQYTWLTRK
ncbi:hypothetical protein B0H17DRAFT_946797 [Mycena rosella]|uniref:Uncharacterized protein n=1 Tax=Mycena rosella TaxID=1033263 RepID=A0AAD7D196_MYCRO|nr:hypothetical protein B0H17DRAFT_946797 [Mycena rosella]